jgi:hypothetical protein
MQKIIPPSFLLPPNSSLLSLPIHVLIKPKAIIQGMKRLSLFTLLSVLLLSACAPRVQSFSDIVNSPAAKEVEQIANIAFHRMEISQLESGVYTTNVLADLALPQGAAWTLESLAQDTYQIRFTSADVQGFAWLVSPDGVKLLPN